MAARKLVYFAHGGLVSMRRPVLALRSGTPDVGSGYRGSAVVRFELVRPSVVAPSSSPGPPEVRERKNGDGREGRSHCVAARRRERASSGWAGQLSIMYPGCRVTKNRRQQVVTYNHPLKYRIVPYLTMKWGVPF